MQLYLEMANEAAESLWVRIRGQTIMGDGVGVCFRPPDQERSSNEALLRQLKSNIHRPWCSWGT